MKSKWTTYLLIVAVIAVWGVVAWKIFFPSQPVAESPVTAKKPSVVADLKEEKLCLDYPDPFLKGGAIDPGADYPTIIFNKKNGSVS